MTQILTIIMNKTDKRLLMIKRDSIFVELFHRVGNRSTIIIGRHISEPSEPRNRNQNPIL